MSIRVSVGTLDTNNLFPVEYTRTEDEDCEVVPVGISVSAAIRSGIGSQLSVHFVKLKVVMAVPSESIGVVNTCDHETRLAALFSPDCSIVPYS